MFNWIGQTIAVTALNLRTIPQRLGSSGVAIIGIAGVVIVLVSVLGSSPVRTTNTRSCTLLGKVSTSFFISSKAQSR